MSDADLRRPYLVVPKLIEQPTWGGTYIVETKGWAGRGNLGQLKIGQSYELFSGSNLSLLDSTDDPKFAGELTDRDAVQIQTAPEGTVSLSQLLEVSPEGVLGAEVMAARGPKIELLIKFTQALGNSFQSHIKASVKHPKWLPKPESWYYFEPGLITLGVKPGADWDAYQATVTTIETNMTELGSQVKAGKITYEEATQRVQDMLAKADPWQFVNTVEVAQDELVDLSGGGVHHSWEEDAKRAPQGNVLIELQAEAMDDVSTFRSFDKGKIGKRGEVRDLQIKEYFEFIDRSPEANDPAAHISRPKNLESTADYRLDQLMQSPYYDLAKLTFKVSSSSFSEHPGRYKHLFVKSGKIEVTTGSGEVQVGLGHSAFVPAAAGGYTIKSLTPDTEVLISY